MAVKPRKFWTENREYIERWVEQGKTKSQQQIECGAGKSSLVPLWAYTLKKLGVIDKVCWVVPRLSLAKQGAKVFLRDSFVWELMGISPDEAADYSIMHQENGNSLNPSKGTLGYAASYNAITSGLAGHIDEFRRFRYLLVRDEPQFAKEDKAFGRAIEQLSQYAAFQLVMSGDFDTNDNTMLADVDYVPKVEKSNEWIVDTDIYYNLTEALNDNAILCIDFAYGDGRAAYEYKEEYFEFDTLTDLQGSEAKLGLRAILKSEYAIDLMSSCFNDWMAHRTVGITRNGVQYPAYPKAQMLVVCGTIYQARQMLDHLLSTTDLRPNEIQLIVSDDEKANKRLESFCENEPLEGYSETVKIAVTVAMAYVGTDAPDVTHLCCLTHYRSAPWIRQMLARAWRLYSDKSYRYEEQYCVAYVPHDPMLQEIIKHIRSMQRLGYKEPDEDGRTGGPPGGGDPFADLMLTDYGQLTNLLLRREFGDVTGSNGYATITLPNVQGIKEYLLSTGLPADLVNEMLAVLDKRSNPRARTKTPQEQQKELMARLDEYQKTTASLIMKEIGVTGEENFRNAKRLVSGKLKLWNMGREPKTLDLDQLQKSYTDRAPRIRTELLEQAQRGEIQL